MAKFDGSAYGEPHFLVIGLDLQYRRHGNEFVHIGNVLVEGESIALHLLQGAFVKEIGVGFYIHQGGGRRNLSVQVEELVTAQTLALLLGLGVGEGDPNFSDLVGGEVLGDVIDMGSQESNIAEVFGDRGLGARPHAVAFDVHAHVIDIGVEAGQTHGIIAFSAGQLYHDGVVVAEKGMPVSFRFLGILKIERVRELVVLGKFDEFGFAHGLQRYCDLAICPKNINFVLCRQYLTNWASDGRQTCMFVGICRCQRAPRATIHRRFILTRRNSNPFGWAVLWDRWRREDRRTARF